MLYEIRPTDTSDREWIAALLKEWWADTMMVTLGKIHHLDTYPGFIAMDGGKRTALATYHIENERCEITSLNSLAEGKGVGTALVEAVKQTARKAGCRRLFLVTTNDNTRALRFWGKRGFVITAVHFNALEETRKLKPGIPLVNEEGIPIRDEIQLEIDL
jgi:N-acetylglutamate synthase-like GNAT family acetyltransferase